MRRDVMLGTVGLFVALFAGSAIATEVRPGIAGREAMPTVPGPVNCKRCVHNLDTNEHWFTSELCESGDDCYDCVAFNSCHTNPQVPFACGAFHWLCAGTTAALDAVDKALASGNHEEQFLEIARVMPSFVSLSVDGYLLVLGCDGQLVAGYSVGAGSDVVDGGTDREKYSLASVLRYSSTWSREWDATIADPFSSHRSQLI